MKLILYLQCEPRTHRGCLSSRCISGARATASSPSGTTVTPTGAASTGRLTPAAHTHARISQHAPHMLKGNVLTDVPQGQSHPSDAFQDWRSRIRGVQYAVQGTRIIKTCAILNTCPLAGVFHSVKPSREFKMAWINMSVHLAHQERFPK